MDIHSLYQQDSMDYTYLLEQCFHSLQLVYILIHCSNRENPATVPHYYFLCYKSDMGLSLKFISENFVSNCLSYGMVTQHWHPIQFIHIFPRLLSFSLQPVSTATVVLIEWLYWI